LEGLLDGFNRKVCMSAIHGLKERDLWVTCEVFYTASFEVFC
jgi:hypothetical protein